MMEMLLLSGRGGMSRRLLGNKKGCCMGEGIVFCVFV